MRKFSESQNAIVVWRAARRERNNQQCKVLAAAWGAEKKTSEMQSKTEEERKEWGRKTVDMCHRGQWDPDWGWWLKVWTRTVGIAQILLLIFENGKGALLVAFVLFVSPMSASLDLFPCVLQQRPTLPSTQAITPRALTSQLFCKVFILRGIHFF